MRGDEDVGGSNENLIVATHTGQLMIYKDTQLIWAARVSSLPPVAVRVAQFGNLPGLITTLDDTGKLSVLYLGTDPPTNSVSGGDAKDLNYEAMDDEHKRLLMIIRESQSGSQVEPKDKIVLRAQIPATTDVVDGRDDSRYDDAVPFRAYGDDGKKIETTIRLYVSFSGMEAIKNVSINFDVPPTYYVKEKSIKLASLGKCHVMIVFDALTPRVCPSHSFFSLHGTRHLAPGTPIIIPFKVVSTSEVCPSSLNIQAAAAYSTENGEPRTSTLTIRLPLSSACKIVPPVKTANFKV